MSRVKSNPLSTRFVQPGRIAWQFIDEQHSLEHLVNYFTCKLNWRAAIVGAHGSGKSTLLEHLVPLLGSILLKRAVHDTQASMSPEPTPTVANSSLAPRREIVWLKMRGATPSASLLRETQELWRQPDRLLVIDGYEQLSLIKRAALMLATSRKRTGLLLTSHRSTSLPTLVRTSVDAAMARRLLEQLLPIDVPNRERLLDAVRLEQLLRSHHGNLREVFMQLYDEIEQ